VDYAILSGIQIILGTSKVQVSNRNGMIGELDYINLGKHHR
jgi:hypothetical protein